MTNLLYEIQLSYIPNREMLKTSPLTSSKRAYEILHKLFDPGLIRAREEFIVLYTNRSNKVIGYHKAFQGGVSGVVCDPKIVLSVAVKSLCSGIILAHNHPSGNITPSKADIDLTERISACCRAMDITLMDHLILSPDGEYFSFADEGRI